MQYGKLHRLLVRQAELEKAAQPTRPSLKSRLATAFAKLNHAIANSHEDGNVERAALMDFREEVRAILDG